MSSRAAWFARIVILSASIVMSFLFGEFIVRRVAPQDLSIWDNTRDGMTVHRVHADVYLPRYDQRIRTNNLGMRDLERNVTKAPGTTRILTLGDSFLEALQVPYEASFPARLEKDVAAAQGPPVEVVNLSVSGWGTDDQLAYLERYGRDLSADGVVIMMTLHNDLSDNAAQEFHVLEGDGLVARPIELMPWPRYAVQKLKAYLAGTSELYRLAYQTSIRGDVHRGATQLNHHVASLLRRDASPELERNWALTFALLDRTADVVQAQGAWLAVGMIPLRVQIDDSAFNDFMESHELLASDMKRDGPQQRIRAWAQSRNITLIDLLPIFTQEADGRGERLYLPFDGHWTAAGHSLASEIVSREVSSRLRRQGDR